VSFLESLACATPLISCEDPGGVVSRFGIAVCRAEGSGVDALPALERALGDLIADRSRRERLGREGRAWVRETHNRDAFLSALHAIRLRLAGRAGWADP
jgi:hypothetical protein